VVDSGFVRTDRDGVGKGADLVNVAVVGGGAAGGALTGTIDTLFPGFAATAGTTTSIVSTDFVGTVWSTASVVEAYIGGALFIE